MKYAIACSSVIPLRPEPSDKCEMLTQVLFGELVQIYKYAGNWASIKNVSDGYLGWIDKKTLIQLTEKQFKKLKCSDKTFILPDFISYATDNNNCKYLLSAGSNLPKYNKKDLSFVIGNKKFNLTNTPLKLGRNKRENICNIAQSFLNCTYLWGGKNPFGIDCSGLSQVVYKIAGINIPRDASKQVEKGTPITFLNESQPGDLAFFDNEEGQIIHVGIILTNNTIIHSSGKVRIDKIDHEGIFNIETQRYTHKLRVIKSILG